jgi:hypothetical protein
VDANRCVSWSGREEPANSGSLCAGLVAFDVFAAFAGW